MAINDAKAVYIWVSDSDNNQCKFRALGFGGSADDAAIRIAELLDADGKNVLITGVKMRAAWEAKHPPGEAATNNSQNVPQST